MANPENVDGNNKKKRGQGPEHLRQWWFKPGQSGHPQGRPPNALSLTNAHRNAMGSEVPERIKLQVGQLVFGRNAEVPPEWLALPMTWRDVIVMRNLHKAMTADGDATIKLLWEMLEGRATLRLAGAEGGAPIHVVNGTYDLKRLTTEELGVLRDKLAKAKQIEED